MFLDKALSFWCDEVLTLQEKRESASNFTATDDTKTGHAESDNTKVDNRRSDDTESSDVSSLDFIRLGLRMVLREQEDIDADYAVLSKNPEWESLASQRAVIAVAPRLQAMIDHGIVESAKPVPNDTPSWREQVAQGRKDRELAEQNESSKAGVSGELGLPKADDNEPVDKPSGNLQAQDPLSFEDEWTLPGSPIDFWNVARFSWEPRVLPNGSNDNKVDVESHRHNLEKPSGQGVTEDTTAGEQHVVE